MDLRELQIERERESANEAQYLRQKTLPEDPKYMWSPAGRKMMKNHVNDLGDKIKARMEVVHSGQAGPGHAALALLGDIDPYHMAYTVLSAALRRLHEPTLSLTVLALHVARHVEIECWTSKHKHRIFAVGCYTNKLGVAGKTEKAAKALLWTDREPWPKLSRAQLGYSLLDMMVETTGWIEIQLVKSKKRVQYLVRRTKVFGQFAAWWLQTDYTPPTELPMVVPPKPWTTYFDGGYLSDAAEPLVLIKGHERDILRKSAVPPLVFEAVNSQQAVEWRINKRVWEVFSAVLTGEMKIDALPERYDPTAFEREVEGETESDRKARKARNRERYLEGISADSKLLQLHILRRIAEPLVDLPVYFPYTLDFRGRMYPVPVFLHPQGQDAAKGLLQFAEGQVLHEGGMRWLKIHGANSWDHGLTKMSFDDRIKFINEHHDQIISCANNPLDVRLWAAAENPWQFLAFCFAYVDALAGKPVHLPIGQDGTCNGLQHFSAMLRDPVGGKATNLIPGDKPRDIYQMVADRVMERALEEGGEIGRAWHAYGIPRAATKRQVMTLPYGATRFSCYGYTREWYDEATKAKGPAFEKHQEAPAIAWLSNTIWHSISDVVIAARTAMDWLGKTAATIGDKEIKWKVPSGLVVRQGYEALDTRRISTIFMGSIIRPRISVGAKVIDPKAQKRGISPNFVHSYDAAHVCLTIHDLLSRGIKTFGFVHDSYVTLPNDADALATCLRDAFVRMHEKPALVDLAEQLRKQGFTVSDPPKGADLDLQEVKQSPYFFA